MRDQPFDREAPERALQLGELDDDAEPRLDVAVDLETVEHLEYRLARLEIFERYGQIALRSRGAHSAVSSVMQAQPSDFEITPMLASDRPPVRRQAQERAGPSHTDVAGTPHERRHTAVGHPANWTAVVAANLPLPPSPVPEPLTLGPQFPTIRIVESELAPDVDDRTWFGRSFDFWTFDRSIDERAGFRFHLTIRTADPDRTLPQILTRCQRLFDRRNAASASSTFDRILKAHHGIHDLVRPLVRTEYDHALDVWQWVLRLDRDATFETQVAALFHDVDRLPSLTSDQGSAP